MRRLFALTLLLAQGCDGSRSGAVAGSSAPSDVYGEPARVLFPGVVERIYERPYGVAVAIRPYAAFYDLRLAHPRFDLYLRYLRQSRDAGRPIRFAFDSNTGEITLVELDSAAGTHAVPAP